MSSTYSVSSGGSSGNTAAKARATAVEQRIYQLSVHSDSTETISTTPLPPLKYIPKVPKLRILLAPYMSPYEIPMNSVRTWDALHRTIRNLFGDTIFSDSPPRITNKKGITICPSEWESLLTPNLTIIVDTCAILPEHNISICSTEKKSTATSKYGYTPGYATSRRRKKSAGRNELKRPIANVNVTAFIDRDSHDSSILDSPISPWGFTNRGSSAALPVLRSRPMEPWEGWTSDSDAASGIVPAPLDPSRVRMKRSIEAMSEAATGKKSAEFKRSTSISMFSGLKRGESQRVASQPKKKSSFASLRGKRSQDFPKGSGEMVRDDVKMNLKQDFPPQQLAVEVPKEKPYTEESEKKTRSGTMPIMSRPRPSLDQVLRPKLSFDQAQNTHIYELQKTAPTKSKTPAPLAPPTRLTVYDPKTPHEPVTKNFEAPPVYEIPKIYEKTKLSTTTTTATSSPKLDEKHLFASELPASEPIQRKKSTKAKTPPKKKSAWSKVINAVLFAFVGRPRNPMINPSLSKPTQHDKHVQDIILDPSRQVPTNPADQYFPSQPKPTVIRPPQIRNLRPDTINIDIPTPQTTSPTHSHSPAKHVTSKPHFHRPQQPPALDNDKSLPPLPPPPAKPSTSAPKETTFTFPRREDSLPFPTLSKAHSANTLISHTPNSSSINSTSNGITSIFRSNSFNRHKKRSSDSSITSISSISPPIPKRGPELDLGCNAQYRTQFMEKEKIQELVHAESYLDGSTVVEGGSTNGRSWSGTIASETTTAVESERSNSQQSRVRTGVQNQYQHQHQPQNQKHQHQQQKGYKLTAFPPPTQRYEVKNTVPSKPNTGVWQAPPLTIPRKIPIPDVPPSPTSIYSTNTCGESFVLGRAGRRVY